MIQVQLAILPKESFVVCHDGKIIGLDRIHSCNADASRKVFEFIFHGIVAQYTVALFVKVSMHMRSSVSVVGFFSHRTVPSSDSSTATNPPSRAVT